MSDRRLGDLAAVIAVLTEHRVILFDLEDFEPVGSLGESVREVMVGSGSLGEADLARLRRWSARWTKIDPAVRRFYRVALRETDLDSPDRRLVESSVWRIVDPATDRWSIDGSARDRLDRLHQRLFGSGSGFDLLPIDLERKIEKIAESSGPDRG